MGHEVDIIIGCASITSTSSTKGPLSCYWQGPSSAGYRLCVVRMLVKPTCMFASTKRALQTAFVHLVGRIMSETGHHSF